MHGSGSLRKAGREEGIRKPGSQKRIESGKEENGKELSAAARKARAEVPRGRSMNSLDRIMTSTAPVDLLFLNSCLPDSFPCFSWFLNSLFSPP
jgi:hypothetical protein